MMLEKFLFLKRADGTMAIGLSKQCHSANKSTHILVHQSDPNLMLFALDNNRKRHQ